MFRVRKQIGCEDAGFTGRNVVAAVLDTGAAVTHPDLAERIIGFKDFVNGRKDCYDDCGHGTHVCGILAGNGTASQGKYRGIAPEALLVVGKVLNYNGDGNMMDMLAGMEWVLRISRNYGIRALNISVGLNDLKDEESKGLLVDAASRLWDAGIAVVAAAGNKGPGPMTISPIGCSAKVITVGCNDGGYFGDRENICENYSGRGPTEYVLKKPDIVAPGTDITSCNLKCRKNYRGYKYAYTEKSGTSMATPIITGAACLYFEKFPCADNEGMKRKMIYTATDLREPWTKQGWGMINIPKFLS